MPTVSRTTHAPWADSHPADPPRLRAAYPVNVSRDQPRTAAWEAATPHRRTWDASWQVASRADTPRRAPWGEYARHLAGTRTLPWIRGTQADQAGQSMPWGAYATRPVLARAATWGRSQTADLNAQTAAWGTYQPRQADHQAAWGRGQTADAQRWLPWVRHSRPLDPGWGIVTEDNAPPVDEHGTIIVPIRGAYIVINEIYLTRVSDALALPALSLSVSLDAESWVCQFQASLPGTALDDVIGDAGSPVELEASINGIPFRLLAEKIARDRRFGKSRLAISGRGIAAVLDAPYAPLVSLASAPAITAQQAMEAAITVAGLPTGWTVDWQLTDWLLPAGLWNHQGTPMSAVNRIASAAGGYVQADANTKILHVLPRYPAAPWDWATTTPEIEIPAAVALTEAIDWQDKPTYNAVYVSGAAGGVLGHVKRTGTAGDLVAQMVTDDLITHTDAARQRGLAILADTGRQARVTLSLPVLDETGIILPGQLVRYVDGGTTRLGLARGVSVSAGLPKTRQTVELETHA